MVIGVVVSTVWIGHLVVIVRWWWWVVLLAGYGVFLLLYVVLEIWVADVGVDACRALHPFLFESVRVVLLRVDFFFAHDLIVVGALVSVVHVFVEHCVCVCVFFFEMCCFGKLDFFWVFGG